MTRSQELGIIQDIFGDVLQIIVAPCDGVINFSNKWPPINAGDALLGLAVPHLGNC